MPAAEVRGRRAPEVVETDFHHRADRRVTGDVPAEIAFAAIGTYDRRHRVPAHIRANALLDRGIAGRALFKVRRDRVDVGRVGRVRDVRAGAARLVDQPFEQEVRTVRTFSFQHRVQRFEPLLGFERVRIVRRADGLKVRNRRHIVSLLLIRNC
jgi:hypothetical protein